MRDKLPKRCRKIECGVINLDNNAGPGTHWVSYYKCNKNCFYFDSFGDLKPPEEFIKYVGDCVIHYNYKRYQKFNTSICGHLCILFLFDLLYKK